MALEWIHAGPCRCSACEVDRTVVLYALASDWGSGYWWARPETRVAPKPPVLAERLA